MASVLGVPLMIARRGGLIVNISSFAAQVRVPPLPYTVAHGAIDRMTKAMAAELRPHRITAISLYPGLVRTEAVLANAEYFDLSNSESPSSSAASLRRWPLIPTY